MSVGELLEDFKRYLPIDDEKYSALISKDGLDGYKLISFSSSVRLAKDGIVVKLLDEDLKTGIIKELNKEGRTIIMVTHSEEVAKFAQRIIHIKDGKIL